ncbi:MAG: RNA polymerase sigma factor [Pseudomonadales bacterium]|nr:RNA polymerase sigma factor [Pseudomonadales bacterium]
MSFTAAITQFTHGQNSANLSVNIQFKSDAKLETTQLSLNQFLSGVELKAFYMARMATGNPDEALDIVQDAMFKLASRYADKPASEWPPLFHRILQNRIRDWHRKKKGPLSIFQALAQHRDSDEEIEAIDVHTPGPGQQTQARHFNRALEMAVKQLPLRQQQAFLLRGWQGFTEKEAATAMGCSVGSIKTHYSRAIKKLRVQLQEFSDEA